jgi:hypothetical protein
MTNGQVIVVLPNERGPEAGPVTSDSDCGSAINGWLGARSRVEP